MNLIWWWTCFDDNWWITDDEGLSMTECPEDWVNLIWWRTCFDDEWWMTDDDGLSMTECPEEWVKLDIEGENEADDFKGCSDLEAGWRKGPSVCLSEGDFNFFKNVWSESLWWLTIPCEFLKNVAADCLLVQRSSSCSFWLEAVVVGSSDVNWVVISVVIGVVISVVISVVICVVISVVDSGISIWERWWQSTSLWNSVKSCSSIRLIHSWCLLTAWTMPKHSIADKTKKTFSIFGEEWKLPMGEKYECGYESSKGET